MKTVEKILKLTRFEQHLYVNRLNKVKAIALAMDLKVNPENLHLISLQVAIEKALNQFPEVRDEVLAIDRGIDYFVKQDEDDGLKFFLKEVARDINEGRLSRGRYHELLPINIFEMKEFDTKEGMLSGTLLAFILPLLNKPNDFLNKLNNYNPEVFENYIKTPNQYVTSKANLETKPLFELYDSYWRGLGLKEEVWQKVTSFIAPKGANIAAKNQEIRVDTHNTASNKSADESHVTAFRIFAQSVAPKTQLRFSNQDKDTQLYREIAIPNSPELNTRVAEKNKELKNKIDALLINDGERKARIYNEFIRYTLEEKYLVKDYKDLQEDEKTDIDIKIKGFIFKAKAAQRYMDDLLTNHRIDGAYAYDTTLAASCGLDMEQMIAACYFATTDSKNFKDKVDKDQGQKSGFVELINWLYDMRRGYDIDFGTDKPDEYIFPKYNGIDINRCHGGSVNSLATALKSIHKAYNIESFSIEFIELDIKSYYKDKDRCNVLEIVNGLKNKPSPQEFAIWTETNIPPKNVKDALEKQFKEKYEKEFDARFGGYQTNYQLSNIKRNALTNVEIPKDLKKFGLQYDTLQTKEIFDSIVNAKLPLFRFDPENGYQTRLQYHLKQDGFAKGLQVYFNALDKNVYSNQQALLFLANSDLPERIAEQIVIKTMGDVQFTLNDIKGLGKEEFAVLIEHTNKKDLLDWCADNPTKTFNLLNIIVSKLVNNLADELKNTYGHADRTILHISSEVEDTALIAKILELPEGKAALSKKDSYNKIPLHLAIECGNIASLAEMLKHNEGKAALSIKECVPPLYFAIREGKTDLLFEMLKHNEGKAALFITFKNDKNNTPMHLAVEFGNVSAIVEMLKYPEGKAALSIKNNKGVTSLHLAARNGHLATIVEMLKHPEGKAALILTEGLFGFGNTPLHVAAENGRVAVIVEMLNHPEGKAALSKGNSYTPLRSAAKNGHVAVIVEILKHPEGKAALSPSGGNTPLHVAAENGHVAAIVEMLKYPEGKAALTIKESDDSCFFSRGNTPLHEAAKNGRLAVIVEMLNHPEGKAALSIKNKEGYTPLQLALERNNNQDIIKILLDNGAVPNLRTLLNNTFSKEIKEKMRSNYYDYLSSTANSVIDNGCKAVEFLSNAMAGPALSNYMNEHKRHTEEQGGTTTKQKTNDHERQ